MEPKNENENEKLDLSVLDPSRDAVKWRKLVNEIARKGIEARRRRLSVFAMLALWVRPCAALAATAAALLLIFSAVRPHTAPTASPMSPDPVAAVLAWAQSDRLPDSETVLWVLGGSHERK